MSFASPSLSQLFLQWGPFRHVRVDVARNADLAPYIGCKEYFMPYRNLKPCQARSRKPTLCTAALCWALHFLMRWDGRRWDRILEAILATPLSCSGMLQCSDSFTPCTRSCTATAAIPARGTAVGNAALPVPRWSGDIQVVTPLQLDEDSNWF